LIPELDGECAISTSIMSAPITAFGRGDGQSVLLLFDKK
jgi:hypothetical protein